MKDEHRQNLSASAIKKVLNCFVNHLLSRESLTGYAAEAKI